MQRFYSVIYLSIALMLISGAAAAQKLDMRLCDKSIETVAKSTFVPRSVLVKIARLESGRRVQDQMVSWPWTLNNAGVGQFFASKSGASEKLQKLMAAGKKNVDVGCMQLNIRWHARYFNSISAMLSPFENVSYAAKYLEQLYRETGSWEKTVKYYHSRNPKFNTVYYAKFRDMAAPDLRQLSQLLLASADQGAFSILQTTAHDENSLIWVVPKGALFFAGKALSTPAFTDIREFRVAPLVPSLQ
jgi:hypothetical protein